MPPQLNCGQLINVYDYNTTYTINYVEIDDCGPADYCSSGVVAEITRGGWSALGHSSMGGTDIANTWW